MKVLVACEFSGIVRDAFIKRGHDALSCDLLPTESPGPHYQGDVFDIIDSEKWDLMIAHPPCTHLAVSGAAWFAEKRKDGRQQAGIDFFMAIANTKIPKTCIENPVCIMSTVWRKPDQIIKPFQFGENSTKKTCLWLKGLDQLKATNIITPEKHTTKSGKKYDKWWFDTCLISDLKLRSKVRSKTFPGIADAMADQWG